MKKAMILGNCQAPVLTNVLNTTNFSKHYQIIKTFPVQLKNAQNLDNETLYSLDLFIHMPVSEVFGKEFSSDYCKQQLKPTCEIMTFPNLFFSAVFPQNTRNPVIRRAPINTTPSGIMPYGDSNCIKMLMDDMPIHKIVDAISDTNFYDKNHLISCVDATYNELKRRESEDKIDIHASDFFLNNYSSKYVSYTVNHPGLDPFLHVAKQILNKLNIPSSDKDFLGLHLGNQLQWPIYPSVIEKLGIKYINKEYEYGYYNNSRMNFRDFMTAYCQHSIGMEFPSFPQDTPADKSNPSQYMLLPCKQSISFLASVNQTLVKDLKGCPSEK